MAWNKLAFHQITCDVCGAPGPVAGSRAEAAAEAALVGWSHKGDPVSQVAEWHCPACKRLAAAFVDDDDMAAIPIVI